VDLEFRGGLLGVYFGLHGGNGRLGSFGAQSGT
jgi:hypothetical protein